MPPKLMTFGISHYCEKSRWALDWHGIRFEEVGWPPGLHIALARRAGARSSSLPILVDGGVLVQGSGRIIDWAEQHTSSGRPSLAPEGERETAQEIERRADDVLGVHVRRLYYAEVLPHHAHLARRWLLLNTTMKHRLLGHLMWPKVRQRMIEAMDAGPEAAPESRARVTAELDWLDDMLADGRRFLTGDRFSRVDLAVAALLAPFARPNESEVYAAMSLPEALREDVARWHERPIMRWVNRIYGEFRR